MIVKPLFDFYSLCSLMSVKSVMRRNTMTYLLVVVSFIWMPTFAEANKLHGLLASTADTLVDMYQDFANESAKLEQSVVQFCKFKNRQTLEHVRTQWVVTAMSWDRLEVYLSGPAIKNERDYHINFWPANSRQIDALVMDVNQELNSKLLSEGSVGRKGISGIEYLLFPENDSATLATFTAVTKYGVRRCQYLHTLAIEVRQHGREILADWLEPPDDYARGYRGATNELTSNLVASELVVELVTNMVRQTEQLRDIKLGKPLGKQTNGVIKPFRLQSWRSGKSLQRMQASLAGVDALFEPMGNYLRQQGKHALSELISAQLIMVAEQLRSIASPFVNALRQDRDKLETLYKQLTNLNALLRHELTEAMGISLGFNSADGD